jgi:hypothetical protein
METGMVCRSAVDVSARTTALCGGLTGERIDPSPPVFQLEDVCS